jgi:hypothetical protein
MNCYSLFIKLFCFRMIRMEKTFYCRFIKKSRYWRKIWTLIPYYTPISGLILHILRLVPKLHLFCQQFLLLNN